MNDVTARLESIEARESIRDLVHRYALYIRSGRAGECAALFSNDANFEVREAAFGGNAPGKTHYRLEGRPAIAEHLQATAAGPRLCPIVNNLLIEVEGATATSTCVMTTRLPDGNTLIGEYHDRYRFEQAWVFTARVFTRFVD